MESVWSVSKLSPNPSAVVANCVHTADADATKQFRRVGGVSSRRRCVHTADATSTVSSRRRRRCVLGFMTMSSRLKGVLKKSDFVDNVSSIASNSYQQIAECVWVGTREWCQTGEAGDWSLG